MPSAARESGAIVVRGALSQPENIDVSLPAGKLIVITGVSGSGKSSLAFDGVCGSSCYVESLSAYARQFERMESPTSIASMGSLLHSSEQVRNPARRSAPSPIHDYVPALRAGGGRSAGSADSQ